MHYCSSLSWRGLLTLSLLLTHDRVAEGQQAEEVVCARLAHFHRLQQPGIVEAEVWVCQGVEGCEVQSLDGSGHTHTHTHTHIPGTGTRGGKYIFNQA